MSIKDTEKKLLQATKDAVKKLLRAAKNMKIKLLLTTALALPQVSSASAPNAKPEKKDKDQPLTEAHTSFVNDNSTVNVLDVIKELRKNLPKGFPNLMDNDTSIVDATNSENMVQCNVKELVEKRSNWICEQLVSAASKRLYDIKHCSNKTEYVKDMFQRLGRGRIYASYCLATVQNIWKDVAENTGNLDNTLPKTCGTYDFLRALRKMGYSDCIKKNPRAKDVHPGDLIFQQGHVTTAEKIKDGRVCVISFNNDKRYPIYGSFECVDMQKLCAKLLIKEMNNIFQNEELTKAAKDGGLVYISSEAWKWLTKDMPTQDTSKKVQLANSSQREL